MRGANWSVFTLSVFLSQTPEGGVAASPQARRPATGPGPGAQLCALPGRPGPHPEQGGPVPGLPKEGLQGLPALRTGRRRRLGPVALRRLPQTDVSGAAFFGTWYTDRRRASTPVDRPVRVYVRLFFARDVKTVL